MPTGKPRVATRAEIVRNGHVAAALRGVMKERGWKPADFNVAIGRIRGHTGIYHWLAGKTAPEPAARAELSKATGIPEAELTPRKLGHQPAPVTTGQPLALPGPAVGPPAPRPVLVFNVLEDASVELELRKVRLPIEEGSALLRMLLDAGVVLRKPA